MTGPAPAAHFLRTLAAAALGEGEPCALAGEAAVALGRVFETEKNLVLDVEFTGCVFRGRPQGRGNEQMLKTTTKLISLRIKRLGFTADAGADDVQALYEAVAMSTAELAGEGVVGYLARHSPRGIYVSTTTGEVYRPPRPAPAAEPAPAPTIAPDETTPPPVPSTDAAPPAAEAPSALADSASWAPAREFGGDFDFAADGGTDLSDFELLDDFPILGSASAPGAPPAPAQAQPSRGEEPGSHDMYHFFRAVNTERADEEAEELPARLRAAMNPTAYDELCEATARVVLRLVRSDLHAQAVELLDALVSEARRPDRTRIFRESADGALRRVGTGETLHHLADLLQYGGQERDRILAFFVHIGGDAVPLLETILFRTADAEVRAAIFRRLAAVEGLAPRLIARTMSDPSPARARIMLELAALPDIDPELAVRWLAEGATHPDAAVRADVARHAAVVGGRGGLRVLLDLLGDRDPQIRRGAVQSLGTLGDAAAVPFLARLLNDDDEELQVAAAGAVGRIGSGEAVPALLGVLNRRAGLFGGKKLQRVKSAALAALARIPTAGAREVLASTAAGKDADLAAEARRILATMG